MPPSWQRFPCSRAKARSERPRACEPQARGGGTLVAIDRCPAGTYARKHQRGSAGCIWRGRSPPAHGTSHSRTRDPTAIRRAQRCYYMRGSRQQGDCPDRVSARQEIPSILQGRRASRAKGLGRCARRRWAPPKKAASRARTGRGLKVFLPHGPRRESAGHARSSIPLPYRLHAGMGTRSDVVRRILIVLRHFRPATRRMSRPERQKHRQRRPTHPVCNQHGSTLLSCFVCLFHAVSTAKRPTQVVCLHPERTIRPTLTHRPDPFRGAFRTHDQMCLVFSVVPPSAIDFFQKGGTTPPIPRREETPPRVYPSPWNSLKKISRACFVPTKVLRPNLI